VLPSDCGKAMQALAAAVPAPGMAMAATFAHGVLRGEITAASPNDLAARLREAREAVNGVGGFLVVTAAPAPIRATLDMWGPTAGDAALMRQLKTAFDPGGVLNPGRFIEGL
jgi:FAD/FMN-containing dehydrogenase